MKASLTFALTCCSLVLLNSTAFSAPVTGDTTNNPPSTWSFTSPTGDTTNNPPCIWSFTSMTPTGATTSKPPRTLTLTSTSPEPSQQPSTATETPHQCNLRRRREGKKRRKDGIYIILRLPKLVEGESKEKRKQRRVNLHKRIGRAVRLCREDDESKKDCRKRLKKEVYDNLVGAITAADSNRIARETLKFAKRRAADMKRRKHISDCHGGTSELPAPFTLHGFEECQHGKGNSVSDTFLPPKTHMNVNSDSLVGTSTRRAPVIIDLAQESESLDILDDSVDTILRLGRN